MLRKRGVRAVRATDDATRFAPRKEVAREIRSPGSSPSAHLELDTSWDQVVWPGGIGIERRGVGGVSALKGRHRTAQGSALGGSRFRRNTGCSSHGREWSPTRAPSGSDRGVTLLYRP